MIDMSLNSKKWYRNSHILCHTFSLPIIIYDKTFSSLDITHCQKSLSLKVAYFVTEVIFGQKCINLLQQNAYN